MTTEPHLDDLEVIPGRIVSRTDGEAYTLEAWVQSGLGVEESAYYTYSRDHALYRLTTDDHPTLVETLDDIIADQYAQYGAIDETETTRLPGDVYEILIRIRDEDAVTPYNSRFDANSAVVHVTPTNDPEIVAHLDEAFDDLRDVVQTD